jgi:Holliday junction resolvasome RuvABC endonuclease subunit
VKVLGLDLSLTATGVALVEDGVAGERWLLKTSSEVSDMDRYEYIARTVVGIVFGQDSNAVVDLVAMEGVFASRNLLVFGRLTALSSIVQYALHRSQVPYVVLTPTAWRKAVFGPTSKVDKEKVRVYAEQRLKEHLGTILVEMVDLNVLEAFLVALAAWKMETGAAPKPVARKPKKVHRAISEEGMAEARFANR